jgi:hypothetical protein
MVAVPNLEKILYVGLLTLILCRYSRHDKRSKLPGWILSHLRDAHLNLSTDMALHIAREVGPLLLSHVVSTSF